MSPVRVCEAPVASNRRRAGSRSHASSASVQVPNLGGLAQRPVAARLRDRIFRKTACCIVWFLIFESVGCAVQPSPTLEVHPQTQVPGKRGRQPRVRSVLRLSNPRFLAGNADGPPCGSCGCLLGMTVASVRHQWRQTVAGLDRVVMHHRHPFKSRYLRTCAERLSNPVSCLRLVRLLLGILAVWAWPLRHEWRADRAIGGVPCSGDRTCAA